MQKKSKLILVKKKMIALSTNINFLTYGNVQVLDQKAIEEPRDCAYCEEK